MGESYAFVCIWRTNWKCQDHTRAHALKMQQGLHAAFIYPIISEKLLSPSTPIYHEKTRYHYQKTVAINMSSSKWPSPFVFPFNCVYRAIFLLYNNSFFNDVKASPKLKRWSTDLRALLYSNYWLCIVKLTNHPNIEFTSTLEFHFSWI